MFYEVDEIQILTESGSPVALNPRFYSSESEARSAYYTTLAAAELSTIPYHEVRILSVGDGGRIFERKIYDRRVSTPEE